MTITISGQAATSDLTSDLRINAPKNSQSFSAYFIDLINSNNLGSTPQVLSISQPTTATDINLTSFGRTTSANDGVDGTVWRLRNGTEVDVDGTLTAFDTEFANTYELPNNTDTFVISPEANGSATHILEVGDTNKTKAAATNSFTGGSSIGEDSYEIIGGSGDDTLRGGSNRDTLIGGEGDDLLVGRGGRDTLTGGAGGDRFRFNNKERDKVTDFDPTDGDVFQIRSQAYSVNADQSIYIGTLNNIKNFGSGNFAYATDKNKLFYDKNGNWGDGGRDTIAITNDFGTPTQGDFEFI